MQHAYGFRSEFWIFKSLSSSSQCYCLLSTPLFLITIVDYRFEKEFLQFRDKWLNQLPQNQTTFFLLIMILELLRNVHSVYWNLLTTKKIIPKSESRKFLLYYCLYETICLFNPGCENSFLTSTWSFRKWFMRQNTRKLCRFNESVSVIILFSRTLL